MLERGFFKDRKKPERKESRYVALARQLLFYAGIIIIVSGLVYMFFNLNRSDVIFHIWLPFIITGIAMVCISLLLGMPVKKPRDYNQ